MTHISRNAIFNGRLKIMRAIIKRKVHFICKFADSVFVRRSLEIIGNKALID